MDTPSGFRQRKCVQSGKFVCCKACEWCGIWFCGLASSRTVISNRVVCCSCQPSFQSMEEDVASFRISVVTPTPPPLLPVLRPVHPPTCFQHYLAFNFLPYISLCQVCILLQPTASKLRLFSCHARLFSLLVLLYYYQYYQCSLLFFIFIFLLHSYSRTRC